MDVFTTAYFFLNDDRIKGNFNEDFFANEVMERSAKDVFAYISFFVYIDNWLSGVQKSVYVVTAMDAKRLDKHVLWFLLRVQSLAEFLMSFVRDLNGDGLKVLNLRASSFSEIKSVNTVQLFLFLLF